MSKKEKVANIIRNAGNCIFCLSQAMQDVLPDKLTPIFYVVSALNQLCEDNQKFNDLLDTFYLRLDSAFKILEVNQFHANYDIAFQRIQDYIADVDKYIETNFPGLSGQENGRTEGVDGNSTEKTQGKEEGKKGEEKRRGGKGERKGNEEEKGKEKRKEKSHADKGNGKSSKNDSEKKSKRSEIVEEVKNKVTELVYKGINIVTATQRLGELRDCIKKFNGIKDLIPVTESFDILTRINDFKAASFWNKHFKADECRYDALKKVLSGSTSVLECDRDELVSLKISMDLFNYVVSWLGGWKNFEEYIKESNPFTKEFFKGASKEVKPPIDVDFGLCDKSGRIEIKPKDTYWYDEDALFSRQLSFIVYYNNNIEKYGWNVFKLAPNGSLKLKLDPGKTHIFKVFSVLEDKGLISKEFAEVIHNYEKHSVKWVNGDGTWISPDEVALSELPTVSSPIFKDLYKMSWGLSTGETKYNPDVNNIRPAIYVSRAAYSLSKKLGYFFSPEILFNLWKNPVNVKESPFANIVLQDYYGDKNAKDFVYNAVLKYNSEFNTYIQMEFPHFKWVPKFDEKELERASDEFDCGCRFKERVEAECMEFSKELTLVVAEYLRNKTVMNLCAVGAQSNIQGYLASPSQKALKKLQPGYIIVFNQSILGDMNTFISNVNVETSNLKSLKRVLASESFRVAGGIFYREISAYISQEKDIWTNPEAKCPVPSVFLPGQVPFSFVEKTFNVKPDDGKNIATASKISEWVKSNPPRIRCYGTVLKAKKKAEKCFIKASTGIEFYARGNFKLEIRRPSSNEPVDSPASTPSSASSNTSVNTTSNTPAGTPSSASSSPPDNTASNAPAGSISNSSSLDGSSKFPKWSFIVLDGSARSIKWDGKYTVHDFVPIEFSYITYVGYRVEFVESNVIFKSIGSAPFITKSKCTTPLSECDIFFESIGEQSLDIINLHNIVSKNEGFNGAKEGEKENVKENKKGDKKEEIKEGKKGESKEDKKEDVEDKKEEIKEDKKEDEKEDKEEDRNEDKEEDVEDKKEEIKVSVSDIEKFVRGYDSKATPMLTQVLVPIDADKKSSALHKSHRSKKSSK